MLVDSFYVYGYHPLLSFSLLYFRMEAALYHFHNRLKMYTSWSLKTRLDVCQWHTKHFSFCIETVNSFDNESLLRFTSKVIGGLTPSFLHNTRHGFINRDSNTFLLLSSKGIFILIVKTRTEIFIAPNGVFITKFCHLIFATN